MEGDEEEVEKEAGEGSLKTWEETASGRRKQQDTHASTHTHACTHTRTLAHTRTYALSERGLLTACLCHSFCPPLVPLESSNPAHSQEWSFTCQRLKTIPLEAQSGRGQVADGIVPVPPLRPFVLE